MSIRLRARIERDFPIEGAAASIISRIEAASAIERVQAAIVLASCGDVREVEHEAALAEIDWRDVLVNGGLADDDWEVVLDRELGR